MTLLLALALALAPALQRTPDDVEAGQLVVVATHPALAAIAREIAGERARVSAITKPAADVHATEAKPSVFAELAGADVFIHTGLDLELWAQDAIDGSRNQRIRADKPGNIDASEGIKLLEVPERPDRTQGDVHIYGNPHYWMDPVNAKTIAATIASGLTAVDPAAAELYLAGRQAFDEQLNRRLKDWLKAAIPHKNTPIVSYHNSFSYLVRRFGFTVAGTVEPKPRIAPTQAHLVELIDVMQAQKVRVIVKEPFQDPSATDFLAERTGAKVVTISTLPGYPAGVETYADLIEHDLNAILGALR